MLCLEAICQVSVVCTQYMNSVFLNVCASIVCARASVNIFKSGQPIPAIVFGMQTIIFSSFVLHNV